jgi:hypothetical protein
MCPKCRLCDWLCPERTRTVMCQWIAQRWTSVGRRTRFACSRSPLSDSFFFDDLQNVIHDRLAKHNGLRTITDFLETWVSAAVA